MDDNIHHMKHEFVAKYILVLFFPYQVHVFVTWFLVKWQEWGVRSPVPGQNATWFLTLDYRQSQRFYVEGLSRERYTLPLDNAQAIYCCKGPRQVLLLYIFGFLAQGLYSWFHSFIPFTWGPGQRSSRSLCWGFLLGEMEAGNHWRQFFRLWLTAQ